MKTALDFRNTWKKRLLPLGGMLLVLVFVCMLSGCKDVRKMSSPQADTAGTAYEVTDVQGTVVSLPEKPHRILTLSMSTDEVVLGLVPPDHMVAVNSLLDDPVSSNVVPLAKEVEGRVTDPTVEEIAAMQPDLIIVPDWGDITRVASLRDLGIPVVVCKGARNLEEIEATVRLIAQAVGEPARGEKLVQKMDDKLAAITEQTSKIPDGEKKTVVLISLMSTYGGSGSSFDDACKYAGVINATPTCCSCRRTTTMARMTSRRSGRSISMIRRSRQSAPSGMAVSRSRTRHTFTTARRTSSSACRKSHIAFTAMRSGRRPGSICLPWTSDRDTFREPEKGRKSS